MRIAIVVESRAVLVTFSAAIDAFIGDLARRGAHRRRERATGAF
jgi:hypothetical protein